MNHPLRQPGQASAAELPRSPDRPGPEATATGSARGAGAVRRIPRPLRFLLGTAIALFGLYLARVPILTGVAEFLSVEDRLRPADLILVLGGEIETRPAHAAELYRRGLAPRILMVRVEDDLPTRMGVYPNETDAAVQLLSRLGVPSSAVIVLRRSEGGAASTTDEAAALRGYLEQNPLDRVMVVTTRYHTRRARWSIRRALDGLPVRIIMAGAVSPKFDERDWWRSEDGLILTFEEYLKFVHNWLYR